MRPPEEMARKLRIQYPGALYHVINRGNYRRDVFETRGACRSFEATLDEACLRYDWRIHAYVIMRNHYHLALETPGANLVEGMHWLQCTFATRFNRYRAAHGHLFQGRYQALLVEDPNTLLRVVHYIDLNPVRAGIVPPDAVATYQWGSLRHFMAGSRPPWLVTDPSATDIDLPHTPASGRNYVDFLIALAGDHNRQRELGFDRMCRGWAIGTAAWKKALAEEYAALALEAGFEREELREIREARWNDALQELLRERSMTASDFTTQPLLWKIELAAQLRRRTGAPYRWIASTLKVEHPASLRNQVSRLALQVSS